MKSDCLKYLLLFSVLLMGFEGIGQYQGTPWPDGFAHPLPGRIEAEHFDDGGPGIAYQEVDAFYGMEGVREELVDLYRTLDYSNDTAVGSFRYDMETEISEWLIYSVHIMASGVYDLKLRIATDDGAYLNVLVDSVRYDSIYLNPTLSSEHFKVFTIDALPLDESQNTQIILEVIEGEISLDWLEFSPDSTLESPLFLRNFLLHQTQAGFRWNEHAEDADGYIISRANLPETNFSFLDSLPSNQLEYVDTDLEPASRYTYRVQAYRGTALSNATEILSILTLPPDHPLPVAHLHLKMDEAFIADHSPRQHRVEMEGVFEIEQGQAFNAQIFNGETFLDVGQFANDFNPATNVVTWTTFFKTSVSDQNMTVMCFTGAQGSLNIDGAIVLEIIDGILSASVRRLGEEVHITTSGEVADNEWHHAAMVWDGENRILSLYHDGSIIGTDHNPNLYLPKGQQEEYPILFSIGTYHEYDGTIRNVNPFIGSLDETRVYNYRLTSDQIQFLSKTTGIFLLGSALMESGPLPQGTVSLFAFPLMDISDPLDEVQIFNNGFRFQNVSPGVYTLRVQPQGIFEDIYLPTYLYDQITPESADPLQVEFPTGNIHVKLRKKQSLDVVRENPYNLTLFPNPAYDQLMLTHHGMFDESTFIITDISGKEISDVSMIPVSKGKWVFDLSCLIPGIYVFSAHNQSFSRQVLFVKKATP